MIKITTEAAKYINSKSEFGFKLSVKNSGCNGYKYDWSLASESVGNDVEVLDNGARILVDKLAYLYVQDATIDLETSTFNSTLRIDNPQVKNTCGCGESISF